MNPPTDVASCSETWLAQVLDDYLAGVQRGEPVNRSAVLAAHPDLAEDLDACFASLDFLRVASPTERCGGVAGAEGPSAARLGDYDIVRELGRGGMGVVYEARHRQLHRRVALKVVLAGRFAPADDLRRFRFEAEAAAHLDHPNIVPIYEVGEFAGLPFFSMKLLEGGSLVDRLNEPPDDDPAAAGGGRRAGIAPAEAAGLVATIARAVHHAHLRGILHRDLKPSNILLDADDRPYVTDFGLAKRLETRDDSTRTGALVGSPPYMAPEQAAGEKRAVTTATDVYGLGAVLYALLTGRPPFRGDTLAETIERVKAGHPDPPSGTNRTISADLEAICLKCLEHAPQRRYRSAEELAEDLDRWRTGRLTLARPLSRPARLRRSMWRRRRHLAAVVAAVMLLGLVGLGTWQSRQLRHAGRLALRQQEALRLRDEDIAARLYVAQIRRAAALAVKGRGGSAVALLDRLRPGSGGEDRRGFEWRYLWNATANAALTCWAGHEGREVYHVEFSPDGRSMATCGQDGTARVWDAAGGHRRLVLRGHEGEVNWVSYAPDGARIVTAGDDATVRVWDAGTGRELAMFGGFARPVVAALFMPDGREVIAVSREGTTVRWDPAIRRRHAACRGGPSEGDWVESLAIAPDGTTAAIAGQGGRLLLWDLSRGGLAPVSRPLTTMETNGLCVAFGADARTFAATLSGNAQAVTYDLASGSTLGVFAGPPRVSFSLAISRDGGTLATGSDDGTLRLWDLRTRSCLVTLTSHTGRIWSIAWAPDGQTIATASRDGTIRTWDTLGIPARARFRGLRRDDDVLRQASSLAFGEGGTSVLVANRAGDVMRCDLITGTTRELRRPDAPASCTAALLAPDGATLASCTSAEPGKPSTQAVVLLDLTHGRTPVRLGPGLDPRFASWSRDGRRIAVADLAGNLNLWDATGRPLGRAVFRFTPGSSLPAFTAAGDVVIGFCGDTHATPGRPIELVVWDTTRSRVERRRPPERGSEPYKIVVAPDGRTLAASDGRLLEFPSLKERDQLIGHDDQITDLAYAPDGHTVATASLDHTVRLWNVATGQELLTLEGHTGPVRVVAFSADGRALASCGDGPGRGLELIVWRTEARSHRGPGGTDPRPPLNQ